MNVKRKKGRKVRERKDKNKREKKINERSEEERERDKRVVKRRNQVKASGFLMKLSRRLSPVQPYLSLARCPTRRHEATPSH